jgi:hypothetical protein
MFSPHEYAGCGCTSLATYAGPRFVTAPAYAYGVEPEKTEKPEGLSTTQKWLVGLAGFAFIYTMHRGLGGFSPPPETQRKPTPTSVAPRKYHLPR